MSKLEEINNLAFDLMHEDLDFREQFEMADKLYELSKPIKLNEYQQIVLEYLKANVNQDGTSPMCSLFLLGGLWESRKFNIKEDVLIDDAYCELDYKQQAEVLQAFAEWGLGHERN